MTSDPQQEYADALASYHEVLARLREAKRHIPPSPQDRRRQRLREEREAERAHYLANKEAIDTEIARIAAKALNILHQKVNFANAENAVGRIRLPVTYTVQPPNDDHE